MWRYACERGPLFGHVNQDGVSTSLFHQQSCLGQETDFDNFMCLFSLNSYSALDPPSYRTLLQFTLECKVNEGCSCNGGDISPTSCNVCSPCPTFQPSDIAAFMKEETMLRNLQLECPATSSNHGAIELPQLTQSCPTTRPPSSTSPPVSSSLNNNNAQMWSLTAMIVVFIGAVVALIAAVIMCQQQTSQTNKKKKGVSPTIPKGLINIFTYEDDPELESINLSPKSEEE